MILQRDIDFRFWPAWFTRKNGQRVGIAWLWFVLWFDNWERSKQ